MEVLRHLVPDSWPKTSCCTTRTDSLSSTITRSGFSSPRIKRASPRMRSRPGTACRLPPATAASDGSSHWTGSPKRDSSRKAGGGPRASINRKSTGSRSCTATGRCSSSCSCETGRRRRPSSASHPTSGSVKERLHPRTKSGNIRPHDVGIRTPCERRIVREELQRHDRKDRPKDPRQRGQPDFGAGGFPHGHDGRRRGLERARTRGAARAVVSRTQHHDRFPLVDGKEGTMEELLRMVAAR